MTNFKMAKLTEVCRVYQPETISKKSLPSNGIYPVYGANGRIGYNDKFNHEDPQLLLGCRGSVGSIHISEPFSWINGNAMVVQPFEDVVTRDYLKYALLGGVNIKDAISGTAQPQITRESLSKISIPVPSLEKQSEIAKKLESAFAEIDLLERNLGLSEERISHLSQSLLSASFTSFEINEESSNSIVNQGITRGRKELSEFASMFTVIPDSQTKVKSSSYLVSGQYAVVDQGKDLIAGYTDSNPTVNVDLLPVIVFGDHTRAVKYIDFPFAAGADGTQILKPSPLTDPKYAFYAVLFAVSKIRSKGYARHFGDLKKIPFPIPPLEEQQAIVVKLDSSFAEIELLNAHIRMQKDLAAGLRKSLLSSTFAQGDVID